MNQMMKSIFGPYSKTEVGALAFSIDWSVHPLGHPTTWKPALKTALTIALNSKFPMFVSWGKDRYFLYNDAYALILGNKHPAAFGKTFQEVWPEIWADIEPMVLTVDRGESVFIENLKLMMNRHGFEEETYFTFSYGPIRSDDGDIEGLFCAVVETTSQVFNEKELKLRSEELRESEEKLNIALLSADIGLWEWNAITGHVNLSDTLMKDWGIDPTKFNHTLEECLELIHEEDREKVWEEIQIATTKNNPYDVVYRVMKPGGEIIWVNAKGRMEADKNNNPVRFLGVTINITDQKASEEELKNALASRDEFLSIASHELKTPLTSLKIQNQFQARLQKKRDPQAFSEEKIISHTQASERLIGRLERLIDDMLDIARIRTNRLTMKREIANLNQVIKDVIERMQGQFVMATGHKVKFQGIDEAYGYIDVLRIEQVVANLLQNALKYGRGKPVEVELKDSTESLLLSCTDQGMGISEENCEKIFDRFERAIDANEVSGLGLGLYISKQIVLAHTGKIWVTSSLGKGSTFYVELPKKVTD